MFFKKGFILHNTLSLWWPYNPSVSISLIFHIFYIYFYILSYGHIDFCFYLLYILFWQICFLIWELSVSCCWLNYYSFFHVTWWILVRRWDGILVENDLMGKQQEVKELNWGTQEESLPSLIAVKSYKLLIYLFSCFIRSILFVNT